MIPLKNIATSTVGRKLLIAASGLAMVLFVIAHLLGNLVLYSPHGAEPFNKYSFFLHSLGKGLILAEVGLLLALIVHMYFALLTTMRNKKARGPMTYNTVKTKGGPSKNTISSRTMWITGLVLFVFLVIHIRSFKFGPDESDGYVTQLNGIEMRDLHRLVIERFQSPLYVVFYMACMIFLGFHLRHGFWSAFQSLGLMYPRWSNTIYRLGVVVAILLAAGFLFIPPWIYFGMPGVSR